MRGSHVMGTRSRRKQSCNNATLMDSGIASATATRAAAAAAAAAVRMETTTHTTSSSSSSRRDGNHHAQPKAGHASRVSLHIDGVGEVGLHDDSGQQVGGDGFALAEDADLQRFAAFNLVMVEEEKGRRRRRTRRRRRRRRKGRRRRTRRRRRRRRR